MAKKYIDADKLKAHIEAKMKILWDRLPDADKEHPTDIELRDLWMYMALECLIDDLDSLQQEQPDFPTTDEEVEKFLVAHPKVEVPDKYKTPDWLFKKLEQPEVDLEDKVTFDCISKKVTMTVRELINYYIDRECCDVAEECGF